MEETFTMQPSGFSASSTMAAPKTWQGRTVPRKLRSIDLPKRVLRQPEDTDVIA